MSDVIPKIIHQIWIGNKPIPQKAIDLRKKVIRLHPDWQHFLWTDDSIKKYNMKLNKIYYASENTGHRSDILRYELIYKFGGIYLDMDMDMQKNMSPLINQESFIVEIPPSRKDLVEFIQTGAFGAKPKNIFLGFLVNQLPIWYEKKIDSGVSVKTGPIFASAMIKRYKEVFGVDPINILPSKYFYPYDFWEKEKELLSFSDSYGIHRWWATWC